MLDPEIARLNKIVGQAHEIRLKLSGLAKAQNGKVHFRPTSKGVTMVGLLAQRPQRGKGGYGADRLRTDFEAEFQRYCEDVRHERPTPEKAVQSFLISNAYQNSYRLEALEAAIGNADPRSNLYFVTDELAIFTSAGKVLCDLLALRRNSAEAVPVIIELKSSRQMTRLIHQVESYAAALQTYSTDFERLYGAVLGTEIRFSAPPEKWIVWPALGSGADRRENLLASRGIRVVQYESKLGGFTFR